jgi:hypothetical protein
MRARIWVSAVVLLTALTACQKSAGRASGGPAEPAAAAADAAPLEMTKAGGPKRADGYWQSTWGDAKSPYYCVGQGSEDKYSLVDDLSMLGECSKKDFQRIPGGWAFETVCAADGVTTVQKGTIKGDFRTAYTIDQTVTQTPGSSVRGTIVARRVGDCPPQVKPGDKVTDLITINMLH